MACNHPVLARPAAASSCSTSERRRPARLVVRYLTGSYFTSLEMAGCSITVSAADPAALALWDAPVHTAALRWSM
ncbi:MAG TPA: dihydroxyacetone kinase subunit DhaK [Caldimonas sp.]|nr:dihydroxyacetone kinase subunit DhaK [Caldimonas sp.]